MINAKPIFSAVLFLLLSQPSLAKPQDHKAPNPSSTNRYEKLGVFTKVLNLVERHYVEDVDFEKLIYGGVKGILSELDPHTSFLSPEIYKNFQLKTSGEFGGLGIEISVRDGKLTIISPIEDSSAWKAGIKPGDQIISIEGQSTKGLTLAEASTMLRNKKKSVKLGILREGFKKPKDFSIKRGKVKIRSVKYTDLDGGYMYLKVTNFIDNTYDQFTEKIRKHTDEHGKIAGLIIDLRSNPGGILDQAVKLSDLFLKEGKIVNVIGRDGKNKESFVAKKEGTLGNFPLILLINEYSASASEILAGALQDNKRAIVMGKRSFGKGSVQSIVKLDDGSALKLTVARYYTPLGKSIQAEGINPDIELDEIDPEMYKKAVINKQAQREKDIKGHLEKERKPAAIDTSSQSVTSKKHIELLQKDLQVFQAYNYLKMSKFLKPSVSTSEQNESL